MGVKKALSIAAATGMLLITGVSINHVAAESYSHSQQQNLNFEGRSMPGIRFDWAELENANFRHADLRNADFSSAVLKDCNMQNADLRGANLSWVKFIRCDMRGAIVNGASFKSAQFPRSMVAGVNFGEANMEDSEMYGADFDTPVPLTVQQILDSLIDPATGKINLSINFDYNKTTIKPEGMELLEKLATALNAPELEGTEFMIEGHTDSIGSHGYNRKLSERRAKRVLTTLTGTFNVNPGILSSQGYGETRPIADNDTDYGRAQNRRVSIVNMTIELDAM